MHGFLVNIIYHEDREAAVEVGYIISSTRYLISRIKYTLPQTFYFIVLNEVQRNSVKIKVNFS